MPTTLPPLSLASHAAPYPHYHNLRERAALYFDPELKLWIASIAEVVQQILQSECCVVRPPADKIPANILGGSAADVFANLVRMNEGQAHQPAKQVLQTSLRSIDFNFHQHTVDNLLERLLGEFPLRSAAHINQWTMAFPVSLMASLCGFSGTTLAQVVNWTSDFVACLSPLSTAEQIEAAHHAARQLQNSFVDLLQNAAAEPHSFLARLQAEAAQQGWQGSDSIIANLIGLLSQTYEATAGLIGNSIVTLHSHPELRQRQSISTEKIGAFIEEVARYDPPVQNTRRFVAHTCCIAGEELQAGCAILLLLAAANRDPLANPHPDVFDIHRTGRRSFTFSQGRHQCPGQQLALSMATAAVSYVLSHSTSDQWQALVWQYRPSLNGRIPLFQQTNFS